MARQPARSATTPSRGRSPRPGGESGPFDPFSALAAFLLRVPTLGLVLVVLAIALVAAILAGAEPLQFLTRPLVRSLGLMAFLLAAALAGLGLLVFLSRLKLSRRRLLLSAGWLMLMVVLTGMLGWLRPAWVLAGQEIVSVTAGGSGGAYLGRSAIGLLIMAACLGGASAILWPRLSLRALSLIPPAGRTVWGWRIPHRLWRITIDGFRALLIHTEEAPPAYARQTSAADPADTDPLGDGLAPAPVPPVAHPPARMRAASRNGAPAGVVDADPAPAMPVGQQSLGSSPWPRPSRDLLAATPAAENAVQDNAARAKLIVETLASFGVDAKVVSVNQGPTVTQFGIEPGWEIKTRTVIERDPSGRPQLDRDGRAKTRQDEVSRTKVRVQKITGLANDLALALAAPAIRIEAPVPGRPMIGIEVPNTNPAMVTLRGVLETAEFQKVGGRSKLALALGQGVSGAVEVADLARMPHLLIAGATGSGKSVCINSIIASILMHATPDEVRFVMVDPKRVELIGYEPIPHLALSKVIVDMEDVVGTLGAVIHEMDDRYKRFSKLGVRNLEAYHKHPNTVERLPQWVVIIDELADLMMTAPFEVETKICRLAQLARATGIHLVIATQRPSVDVITGLIKANFPTRIAFAVTSQVDSRTILDTGGAEKLLGRGDMLYLATDAAKPRRVQGVFVSDQEIERLVNFWANEKFAPYRPPTFDHLVEEAKAEAHKDEEDDPLLERARELADEHTRISTSMLQRRLRIGYPRAARLMDLLESEGVVGSPEGGGTRPVFDSERDFE